mgnify:FL=1
MLTFFMIIAIVVCIYIGFVWQQRLFASIQVQKTTDILVQNPRDIRGAQSTILKALNSYFNPADLRYASEMSLIRPMELINKSQGVVSPQNITQDVLSDITFAIDSARRASIDRGISKDYKDWIQLGKVYEAATFLGATSTATLAVEAYAEAERLNPTSPVPPYLIGRMYTLARVYQVAEEKLKKSLELKPDYTEALNLLNSVSQGERNVSQLVTPPQNSTSTTPKK